LSNNPEAKLNDTSLPDCNLRVPLWKVVRASTAAPTYFDPEHIQLGEHTYVFVDGAITPYNNPALIAAQMAVLPPYKMNWQTGPDELRLVSVGTLRFSSALPEKAQRLWLGYNAKKIPAALMEGVAWQQDYMCRCLGQCIFGEPLDSEVGTLMDLDLPGRAWFSYVRYNKSFKGDEMAAALRNFPTLAALDAVSSIPPLRAIAREYAEQNVSPEHLI
jgi:hypothetical protein